MESTTYKLNRSHHIDSSKPGTPEAVELSLLGEGTDYTVYTTDCESAKIDPNDLPGTITWKCMCFDFSMNWEGYATYHQPGENVVLQVYLE
jgi:hypothetical protein